MGRHKSSLGRGRWRFFRHDAGKAAGPPPFVYVLLFIAAQIFGLWSALSLHATVMWPANAILLAAILQLHRHKAISVLFACAAINLVSNVIRGDPTVFAVTNVGLNLMQVLVAALLARRLCGAALDMRRPVRLFRFAVGSVAPAVAASTVLAGLIAILVGRMPEGTLAFRMRHLFDMELLAMLIVTPSLLLLARNHRFRDDAQAKPLEAAILIGLVVAAATWSFGQSLAPILFIVFPPLILLAFRLSPPATAGVVILIAVIGGAATVTGHGPVALTRLTPDPSLDAIPPVMRQMNVFHLFLLA
ncbi:hypothetical protein LTR94_025267, partial [Friedmanniomyces endolithicus]